MTDIIKSIVDHHADQLGIGAPTEPPRAPPARAVRSSAYREPTRDNFLEREPPRRTDLARNARDLVREVAARNSSGVRIGFSEAEWARLVTLVVRDFGDAIESAGFVWTTAQIGEVRAFADQFMRECGFYDGAVFRPITVIEKE
jgi:hypothetical protein